MEHQSFRKGIDCIGVGVSFYCHDGNGRFVMAKRGQNARDEHGRWEIGGGGVEFGHTIEETLRKEIKEEYCADVLEYEFLGYQDVHRFHEGKPTHWVTLNFKVRVDPAEVRNGEPEVCDEVRWVTLDAMPEPRHSQIADFLNKYRHKL